MSTETTVQNLKINKLTKAQFDTITPSATEAYELTDLSNILDSKLQNTATGTNALTVGGYASTTNSGTNLGINSRASATAATALGNTSTASGSYSTAIGRNSTASANSAIQIGFGTNSTANSLSVGFYNNASTHYGWQLLDGVTGLIPDARLSSNIARTSAIPTVNNATLTITQGGTPKGTFTANASSDVTIDLDTGGTATTVKINGTSITSNNVADIKTNGTYDASTNKIATMADLNGKADVDGSNMNASVKNFDGQWVKSNTTLLDSVTLKSSSGLQQCSLASYLPNDSYIYEVYITGFGTGTASSSGAYCWLFTDIIGDTATLSSTTYGAHIFRATGAGTAAGAITIPVGTERKLYVYCSNTSNATINIRALGYRRIGTNL